MAETTIRRFREGDRATIRRITAAGFVNVSIDHNLERMLGPTGGTDWIQRKTAVVDADLDSYADHVFVAECDGTVTGYITNAVDHTTRIGHIRNLAIDPPHQGKGIGRSLIERSLQYFRDCGMQTAKIETLEQNEICTAFYPSFGFREYARQVYYAMNL